jgi:hypothetical protein
MSLLAAFVAMLGKQWLNRYLRHTGGSMVERCGDRQRKIDGLEKWPFRLFIESLPVMLQIALLLLSCGLSRYVWSVNISVARVVISFTVLGVIFYIVIVIAGTSSYECPFQTPASTALRALQTKGTIWRSLASLSLPRVISFVHVTWKDLQRGLISRYRRIRDTMVNPRPWAISSLTVSGIATNVGYQGHHPTPPRRSSFRECKAQAGPRGSKVQMRVMLLPITHEGRRPSAAHVLQPQDGLLVPVRDIASLRKQNADNARCVRWIIRNITDPEAIDAAIRLAGTIHWFDGDVDVDPPFHFIVSTFEACFDSAGGPYPGMIDRAYFSGRAILRINTAARLQECASKYPIPLERRSSALGIDDVDLRHILYQFSGDPRSSRFLGYPRNSGSVGFQYASQMSTPTRSMWLSNLHVDLAWVDPDSTTHTYLSKTNVITPLGRASDANSLLSWYIFLGGPVQEETFWADDKSYVVTLSLPLLARSIALCQ